MEGIAGPEKVISLLVYFTAGSGEREGDARLPFVTIMLPHDRICILDEEIEERPRLRTTAGKARIKCVTSRDRLECSGWRHETHFPYLVPDLPWKVEKGHHSGWNDIDV
jgi:hypothetical protein